MIKRFFATCIGGSNGKYNGEHHRDADQGQWKFCVQFKPDADVGCVDCKNGDNNCIYAEDRTYAFENVHTVTYNKFIFNNLDFCELNFISLNFTLTSERDTTRNN